MTMPRCTRSSIFLRSEKIDQTMRDKTTTPTIVMFSINTITASHTYYIAP